MGSRHRCFLSFSIIPVRVSERVANMPDPRATAQYQYFNYVESQIYILRAFHISRMHRQIDLCDTCDLLLFPVVHGLARQTANEVRARLYLQEHESAVLARHDVYFANAAAEVGFEHGKAVLLKVFHGSPFSPFPYVQETPPSAAYIQPAYHAGAGRIILPYIYFNVNRYIIFIFFGAGFD
jgi:hypothetical protein